MKKEDVLFFLVALFISVILACLITNGDQAKSKKDPVMIDSEIQYDSIRDGHYLTKKLNENEETNFCIRTSFRNNVRFV